LHTRSVAHGRPQLTLPSYCRSLVCCFARRYGQQLRDKTHRYKQAKEELQKIQQESVVLHRTEQILKGRDRNLEEFLRQQEAKAGVTGYRDAQSRLEMASEQTAEMDDMKGQTLDEISDLVKVRHVAMDW
jgi:intraflagellar transport protein 81